METFKQAMGFLMMLAVFWLMETLQSLMIEQDKFFNVLWAFTAMAAALWLYGKYSPPYIDKNKRIIGILAAIILGALSITYGANKLKEKTVLNWEKFDEAKLNKHLADGKKVFIDFTATWCATCQVNKKLPYIQILRYSTKKGVILMKGDNTKHDPIINKWLDTYDSPWSSSESFVRWQGLKAYQIPRNLYQGNARRTATKA